MRQLTQLEKRLLRIIALQQQMEATGAVGDFAKTINYTANQLKQLQETFKEIKRWVSQYLMVALQPVVEYTLSFSIAIREVLKYLNEMAGYKYEESGAGGFFGEEASEIENANEALNEYKTNLLGFDKLNVLGDNESAISDVGFLTNAILKYESKLTDVKNKANDIAKSMLEWLGYTYDTNGNLQKTGGALDNIIAGVGMLLASLGTFKLIEFLAPILQLQVLADKSLVILGSSDKIIASLGTTTLGVIGAIIAVLAILYTYSDDFRKSVNNLIKSIGEVLKPIIEVIFDLIKSLLPIVTSILDTLANMLSPIINDVGDIILSIADVLVSLKPLFSYIIDFVSNVLLNAIRAVLSLIEAIWSIVSGIVGVVSQGLVGAFQSLAAIIEGVTKGFSALLSGDERGFIEAFGVMADKLKKIWEGVWNNIKAIGIGVLNGIIQGFAKFVNGLSGMINGITSLLSDVYSWTGIPRIPEIPKWNPNPIELATGGVITEPTHALVGEYKGAKSNPEIVTPENLMREVFIESMLPIAQAIMSGNKEVVNAIEDMANRPIELNGRKVSENLYSHLENVAIRKGKTLFGT